MNARLKTRLRKLEQQYGASGLTEEKVRERMESAVIDTLSDTELDAFEQYCRLSDNGGPEAASAEQKTAWETYEQRYRELRSTGKLVVNGCEVLRLQAVAPPRGRH